jgi:uncharacterized protein YcbK (DUF882 family)
MIMSNRSKLTSPAPRTASRRTFLCSAITLCGAAGAWVAAPAWATTVVDPAPGRTAAARSLSFVHTHTGETLHAEYFRDGCYQDACLTQVNHLLRDFRTGDVHVIDPGLLDILFDLQTLADRDGPFEVISGYRSPKTNEMLRSLTDGVAQHSMHLQGRAIDIRLAGFSTSTLAVHARALHRGGVGFYPASDFVHVDTGRVRYW